MNKVRIPIMVEPARAAGKEVSYEGVVPPKHLTRLQDMLLEASADISVQVSFRLDEQGVPTLDGRAQTFVKVLCERCHEPMELELNIDFNYAVVKTEQEIELLPEHYNAVVANELGEIHLHHIIEDELILAMPIVPMHDAELCKVDPDAMVFGELPEAAKQDNPFAVLKKLKVKD